VEFTTTNGYKFQVDEEDADLIVGKKWRLHKDRPSRHACIERASTKAERTEGSMLIRFTHSTDSIGI